MIEKHPNIIFQLRKAMKMTEKATDLVLHYGNLLDGTIGLEEVPKSPLVGVYADVVHKQHQLTILEACHGTLVSHLTQRRRSWRVELRERE